MEYEVEGQEQDLVPQAALIEGRDCEYLRRSQVREGARCCGRVLGRSGGTGEGREVAPRCTGRRGTKVRSAKRSGDVLYLCLSVE